MVEPTPLLRTYTPAQGVKYLPLEVKEEVGPKENLTSRAEWGGKKGEGNIPKQKEKVRKMRENELLAGRERTKIESEEKRKGSLKSTPI